ncbi:hypothetical protein KGF56_002445 [Candida oxycetoniae]|uniref:Acyl-protein thioesterase 1 n=1 Tax=Candida oxycetoniae TaxID=497107 RepID=A0AAI9WXW4_9ASCO|nr:uncharacterized protein KGF56_002445 [Candida oxycetoniae]KAI3404742.1 hypothetical protein KGF56_002445 [Candida oxycetoniae]
MTVVPGIRVPAKLPPKACLIFLHGLGDTGEGWSFLSRVIRQSRLIPAEVGNSTCFIFPDAPQLNITVNNGMLLPAWFDIYEFGNPNAEQDVAGFFKTCTTVLKALVDDQINRQHIPAEKIIIGGFSQGAAIALATLALLDYKIGGVIALSGFITPAVAQELEKKHLVKHVNYETPIFQGHGKADSMISYRFGEKTCTYYKNKLGFKNLEFHGYSRVSHGASEEELEDVIKFVKKILCD